MNGYWTHAGYMGWVPDRQRYVLFATDRDYHEYMEEKKRILKSANTVFVWVVLRGGAVLRLVWLCFI